MNKARIASVFYLLRIAGGAIGMTSRFITLYAARLWRICFALFIATTSFFLGPVRRIPEVLRIPALLPVPVLAVLVTLAYWLWRVRIRKTFLGIVGVSTPQVSGATK